MVKTPIVVSEFVSAICNSQKSFSLPLFCNARSGQLFNNKKFSLFCPLAISNECSKKRGTHFVVL